MTDLGGIGCLPASSSVLGPSSSDPGPLGGAVVAMSHRVLDSHMGRRIHVSGTCHTEIAQAAKCQAAVLVNGQVDA